MKALAVAKKILFPAIDLKDGQCVRLKLGDMDEATVYNDSPAAQAKAFEDQGFEVDGVDYEADVNPDVPIEQLV